MCGVYGIETINEISEDNNNIANLNFKEVEYCLDDLIHRGPDSNTIICSKDKSWIVGQSRLAIVGTDSTTKDKYENSIKFENANGESLLVFNGEIYNYKDFQKKLENLGYNFKTSTDSEVLLKALTHYGEDVIKELDGQFAFFFRNSRDKKVIMARDMTGKKPLYYSCKDGRLRFSSEPGTLSKIIGFKPNIEAIANLFLNGVFFSSGGEKIGESIYEGIEQVKPGEVVTYFEKNKKIKKYNFVNLSLNDGDYNCDFEFNKNELRENLRKAIEKRIPNEVKVGVALSGGLDSSIITLTTANNIKNRKKNKLIAASIFYDTQKENSDYKFAKQVSNYSDNIALVKTMISPNNFLDDLGDIVRALGIQNSIRQIAMYKNYKTLKKSGVKVVLVGEGADEFNWGYWHRFTGFKEDQRKRLLLQDFQKAMTESRKYTEKLFCKNVRDSINFKKMEGYLIDIFNSFKTKDQGKKMMGLYATLFLDYLNKANDRLAMANSIEARFPFQDAKLIEVCLKIPKKMQVDDYGEKIVLREAFKDILPKIIYERLKNPLPAALHIEYHKIIAGEFGSRLKSIDPGFWTIFDREVWGKISESYNKKIDNLIKKYNDPEEAGEKLMSRRTLTEKADIICGEDVRTNDVFKLLTTLVWYEQNLPYIKKYV